jgi:hypothetical protein
MRKDNESLLREHELAVIDSVVCGGGEARPEDAELVDFALIVRSARPVPDHGAVLRMDEQFETSRAARPRKADSALRPLAAVCAVLLLALTVVAGGSRLLDRSETVTPLSLEQSNDSGVALPPEGEVSADVESLTQSTKSPAGAVAGSGPRQQEQTASISLAATPQRFDPVASRIIAAADRAGGFVQTSRVGSSPSGRASGNFLLMIPAQKFPAVMAELSSLASVRARSQEVNDITAEFNAAERTLRIRRERVERLMRELANATTTAVRSRIAGQLARAKAAERQARAAVRVNRNRVDYVPLEVNLRSDPKAATAGEGTIGKALTRAKEILEWMLGALIVAAAVLVPLALLALACWWCALRLRRRRIERTLAGSAAAPPQ